MTVSVRHGIASALAGLAMTFAAASLFAADAAYPTKPVRLLMGPAAGGPTDSVGRALATRLSEMWKQGVVVENRPGAGNTGVNGAGFRFPTLENLDPALFISVNDAA